MPHKVEFTPAAAREFRKLERGARVRISRAIEKLANNPRPDAVRKLSDGSYRIRVGDFRILYQVHDDLLLVIVIRVRDRKDAY